MSGSSLHEAGPDVLIPLLDSHVFVSSTSNTGVRPSSPKAPESRCLSKSASSSAASLCGAALFFHPERYLYTFCVFSHHQHTPAIFSHGLTRTYYKGAGSQSSGEYYDFCVLTGEESSKCLDFAVCLKAASQQLSNLLLHILILAEFPFRTHISLQ